MISGGVSQAGEGKPHRRRSSGGTVKSPVAVAGEEARVVAGARAALPR
jgi:hypothetical protein